MQGGLGIDLTYPVYHYFVAAKHQEFALGGAAAELCRVGRMYHGSASLPPLGKELVAAFLYSFTRRVHRIPAANGPGRSW